MKNISLIIKGFFIGVGKIIPGVVVLYLLLQWEYMTN